ncbi:N-acetylmuramoyl-L-alanine amidase family protein, partial [Clostridium butyricum]
MFRRSSKLTAILVAAAAVVSIVPATAAERLGTKDGNIENATAFEGGYIYDGYRTDDDDTALYYNNGTKDVNADKDEDYDTYDLSRYGKKYATVKDGSDQYLVDLSNGKIDDEETLDDKLENAKNKLKSKINKVDRYEKFDAFVSNDKYDKDKDDQNYVVKVLDDKYGDVWYKYKAKGDNDAEDRTTGSAVGYYLGFTNDSGQYIDVTQTANMYVYDKKEHKTVKVEEYGKKSGENNIIVRLDDVDILTQDKDYIYTVAKVTVDGDTQYFFQKISKEQGDKKDGAYLPKNVSSYQLDNETLYDDGDMHTAYKVLVQKNDDIKEDGTKAGHETVNVEVSGGMVYVTTVSKGNDENANVKIYKLKFKKDKINAKDKTKNVDTSVIKKDGDGDHDTVSRNNTDKGDVYSIDANGNTWILDKGKIYKVDGTDFKEVYTVDRSLNKLDVYDENNLIAWDSEGEVYTTVSEGKKQTEADAGVDEDKKDETPVVKAGWDKNADGTWTFYKDGAKATGWLNDKGTWYYLDAAGTMKTGWVQAGAWYYLNASGAMQTGWVNDNGTWYYCNGSGAMQTGWLLDGSTWYYLNANGSMAANTTVDGYVLGANGA